MSDQPEDFAPDSSLDMAPEDWYAPDAATFGDRLAAAREQANMSQAQLARRLGVKSSTLRAWEQDVAEPRANRLSMMAGLLGVSMMWLLNGEGDGLEAPGAVDDGLDEDIGAMLSEMRQLRTSIKHASDSLARLEKRMRARLGERT